MRITKFTVALPALFLGVALTSAPSDAQSLSSAQWYASGNIGAVQVTESEFGDSTGTVDLTYGTGLGINGAVGAAFDNVRVEGELSYRSSNLDEIGFGGISLPIEGDTTSMGFMANSWYDFDTGTPWKPFVGGGIGFARVATEIISIAGVPFAFDGDDTVFAYQVGVGVGYQVSPTLVATLGYRFYGTGNAEYEEVGVTNELEYQTHNIEVGVRFAF